jgi:hypothetical protein
MKSIKQAARVLFLTVPGWICAPAQLHPEGSSAMLYFPHFVDGGPADGEQWRTTITLTNSNHLGRGADVTLLFFDDQGRPLEMDFGAGVAATHRVQVPAGGLRALVSRMASAATRSGWAVAFSDFPVQGSVAFRQLVRGRATVEITALATLPTLTYDSVATAQLGIALANPWESATTVIVQLRDANGTPLSSLPLTLPPLGHRAFNLGGLFSGLPADFRGTVSISSAETSPPHDFVAWTVYADTSVISSLPSGRYAWPVPHHERIVTAFSKLHAAAETIFPDVFRPPVKLKILLDKEVNAYASGGEEVGVYLALSELIGDADSELAFVIGHELAHIWQHRTGQRSIEPELEADAVGTILLLAAGYDPYAGAGTLGKLQIASRIQGLLGEALRQEDIHRSFATRIQTAYETLRTACSFNAELQRLCQQYKSLVHPHFPDHLPLEVPDSAPR